MPCNAAFWRHASDVDNGGTVGLAAAVAAAVVAAPAAGNDKGDGLTATPLPRV